MIASYSCLAENGWYLVWDLGRYHKYLSYVYNFRRHYLLASNRAQNQMVPCSGPGQVFFLMLTGECKPCPEADEPLLEYF